MYKYELPADAVARASKVIIDNAKPVEVAQDFRRIVAPHRKRCRDRTWRISDARVILPGHALGSRQP